MRKLYNAAYMYFTDGRLFFFLILAVLFLIFLGIGGFMAARETTEKVAEFSNSIIYSVNQLSDTRFTTFLNSLASISFTVMLMWFCGFLGKICCIFICGAVISFKGVVTGYTIGMLIGAFNLKGILVSVVSILPQYIILLPLMFFVSASAYGYTVKKISTKIYFLKAIIFTLIGAFAAILDGYISSLLMKIVIK